ncbi:MAG: carbohydrate-binding protein [Planctomycetes bacterium]|nr:carbohydrate-binding protein [Planctomycetota bacterium]
MNVKCFVKFLFMLGAVIGAPSTVAAYQPNIVFVLGDDINRDTWGAYGGVNCKTPNIDRLADDGLKFDRAYCTTAMCAPYRQELYSGRTPWRTGTLSNHSHSAEGTKSIAHYLQDLGYEVALTGKSHVGPSDSYPFTKISGSSELSDDNDKFLDAASQLFDSCTAEGEEKPFCLFIGSHDAHLPYKDGDPSAYNAEELIVPPYWVDTPETRAEMVNYYAEITNFDELVGRVRAELENRNLWENTIFMVCGEQGTALPFAKWTCYENGLRSGLIAHWSGVTQPGTVSDELVAITDITPTLVEAAGGSVETIDCDGKSFLNMMKGEEQVINDYVYGAFTNCNISGNDNRVFPIRVIRNKSFSLIYNANYTERTSNQIIGGALNYLDDGKIPKNPNTAASWAILPVKTEREEALVYKLHHRPEFELYDLENDPYELTNEIDNPLYADTVNELKQQLFVRLAELNDSDPIATEMAIRSRETGEVRVKLKEDIAKSITLGMLDNENELVDSTGWTFTVLSQPSSGNLSGEAPNLTYTPYNNFVGEDSFEYEAKDSNGDMLYVAPVSIKVKSVNDAPVAEEQNISILGSSPEIIELTSSDVDSNKMTYILVSTPAHGVLSGDPPTLTYTPNADYSGSDEFSFMVNDGELDSELATVSITIEEKISFPFTVEAENYEAMSGILTSSCKDIDGGENIGWVDAGDWMEYTIKVNYAKEYRIDYRYAANQKNIKLDLISGSTVLGSLDAAPTGGWQIWNTASHYVALPAGESTLRIEANGGGWNLNWFKVVEVAEAVPAKIEAENYDTMSGVIISGADDIDGGQKVSSINTGDWMKYNIRVKHAGEFRIDYRYAANKNNMRLNLMYGTTVIGNIDAAPTGGWQIWDTASHFVTLPAGEISLHIEVVGGGWNLNWFEIVEDDSNTPPPPITPSLFEAEDYKAMSGVGINNNCKDIDGGKNIGWVNAGDWMEYDIVVDVAGEYRIDYRYAANSQNAQFNLISGTTVLGTIDALPTGGWQTWNTVSQYIDLPAGEHTLRIEALGAGWNLNWFKVIY